MFSLKYIYNHEDYFLYVDSRGHLSMMSQPNPKLAYSSRDNAQVILNRLIEQGVFEDYKINPDKVLIFEHSGPLDSLPVEAFIEMCFQDRFSIIVPTGLENYARSHLAEIVMKARVTGVLIQHFGAKYFYHQAQPTDIERILQQGFHTVPGRESSEYANYSFGSGLYCYENPTSHTSPENVLQIDYCGPYLEAIFKDDAPEDYITEFIIYPECIRNVTRALETTSYF